MNPEFPHCSPAGLVQLCSEGGLAISLVKVGVVCHQLTFGEYPTADAMNSANDAIQSIEKLQSTSCSFSGRFDDLFAQT